MGTIAIPRILLPKHTDMSAWAVIACDQYTSDGEYWRNLCSFVGNKPSTLNLIYPEIYLGHDSGARIERINSTMREYLGSGVFYEYDGMVLVERTTRSGMRTGLVLAVDLEDYSFEEGADSLIRSTEATILERIPPRVAIRRNALIELPHIMLLYDDVQNAVLSSVVRGETLYDFDLNMGGGHVAGYKVENSQNVANVLTSLRREGGPLFLVGDGNHSLATAKTCWEELKTSLSFAERQNHPARFCLVEVVNIHDPALRFEPIHRFVKTDKPDLFVNGLAIGGEGKAVVMVCDRRGAVHFPTDIPAGIRSLDSYIADFIAANGGEVDYIHGKNELLQLSQKGVGIALPGIKKSELFNLVVTGGNLPRKTFSMGDGNEKRYYIEAKAIR